MSNNLQKTNLVLVAANLPEEFQGSPQQLFAAIIARIKIMSPAGTNFIVIGDSEPTSNQGPWLKGGTEWYVWDEATKRYIPQDLSASETLWIQTGTTTPSTSTPPVWRRTNGAGDTIDFYFWNGTLWAPGSGIVQSGPTTSRPASPLALQRFYDETIATEIWYERSAWRTVTGCPGDVKSVAYERLTDALAANPGWEVLGAEQQAWRGRLISQATADPGGSPETVLSVNPGVAQRVAHEVFGETDGIKLDSSSDVPYPPTLALWTLVKL